MLKENCRQSAVGTQAWKRAFALGRQGKCYRGGVCGLFLKKAQKLKREANEIENTRRGKHSEQNSKEARKRGNFPCNILAGCPVERFAG